MPDLRGQSWTFEVKVWTLEAKAKNFVLGEPRGEGLHHYEQYQGKRW